MATLKRLGGKALALIGNQSLLSRSPLRTTGGVGAGDRANFGMSGAARNIFAGDAGVANYSSIPNGYRHPYSWIQPVKAGGLSSINQMDASIAISNGSAAAGINLVSPITATGILSNAAMTLIGNFSSTISTIGAFVSAPVISGSLAASAAITAAVSITNGALGTLSGAAAAITASLINSALLNSKGNISADINPFTDLTPQSLASEIFDANDIESGYTLRQSLRLVLSALVGKLSGAPGTSISIRDINDTVDRIVATVDSNGNRTAVTKDVS